MNKTIKNFLTAFWRTLLCALLLMLLAFLLILLPPVQRWASRAVADAIHQASGLPVSVGNVSYFPLTTLKISHIVIADADSLPLISCMSAKADLSFSSIWRRAFVVNNLIVDSLNVALRQRPDGSFNYQDLLLSADSVPADDAPSLDFVLYSAESSHCSFSLARADADSLSLSNVGLQLSNFHKSNSALDMQLRRLSFDVDGQPLHTNINALFSAQADTLRLWSLVASSGRSSIALDSAWAVLAPEGLKSFGLDNLKCQADSSLLSWLGSRPLPSVSLQTSLSADSLLVSIPVLHLSAASHTNLDLSCSVRRDWRSNPSAVSQVRIVAASSSPSDVNLLLGDDFFSPDVADVLGLVSLRGDARLSGRLASLSLDAACDAASVALDCHATASPEWDGGSLDSDVSLSLAPGDLLSRADMDFSVHGEADNYDFQKIKVNGLAEHVIFAGHDYEKVELVANADAENSLVLTLGVEDDDAPILIKAQSSLANGAPSPALLPWEFSVDCLGAHLDRLNLTPQHPGANLAFSLSANGLGLNPDAMSASALIPSLDFSDADNNLHLSNIVAQLDALSSNDSHHFSLHADSLCDVSVDGIFDFPGLASEAAYQLSLALPAAFGSLAPPRRPQQADFLAHLVNLQPLLHVWLPDVSIQDSLLLAGRFDSESHSAWAQLRTSSLSTPQVATVGLNVAFVSSQSHVTSVVSASDVALPALGHLANFEFDASASNDFLTTDIQWAKGLINAESSFSRSSGDALIANVAVDQSYVVFDDSLWTIDSCRLAFMPQHVDVNHFKIQSGDRFVALQGSASQSPDDSLSITLNRIVLDDFVDNDNPDARFTLRGDLFADASVAALFGSPVVSANARISRLWVDGDNLENLFVDGSWDDNDDKINLDLAIVTGGATRAHALGAVDLARSDLNLDFNLDSLSTGFLLFYLDKCMKSWRGSTSGSLRLYGPLDNIQLDAALKLNDDNRFTVASTGVSYRIDRQDSVILSPTIMDFRNIRFSDPNGKSGVFSGYIDHDMFSNLFMNMNIHVDDQLVMDLLPRQSPTYYGTVFANGDLAVIGSSNDVRLVVNARTAPGTTFSVAPMAKGDVSSPASSHVRFHSKNNDQPDDVDLEKLLSSVTASIALDVTPDADVSVVVNESTGNKLKGSGAGHLNLGIDNSGALSMNGTYTIENGKYNYSFERVLNRQFDINKGGTISWNGDPYDALIDISASYKTQASLYDLVQGSSADVSSADLKRRVPVVCKIFVKNKLLSPDISFDVEIQSSQNYSQYTFDQYVNTKEEREMQVFSLLVSGRFYAAQDAQNASQNYLGSAASALLSNQLSSLISQNKYDVDVGVNYRPGDEMINEEYEVELSTQMLNNKIILSGNVGYGRDVSGSASESNGSFVGDFDVEVKLNQRGNIRAKAYTHSNNDVIYESSPTTQGIGVSVQEEFNSFRELFRRYFDAIFHRRRKQVEK